eukprot:9551841-Ditylum_brightwellii.AAC.1
MSKEKDKIAMKEYTVVDSYVNFDGKKTNGNDDIKPFPFIGNVGISGNDKKCLCNADCVCKKYIRKGKSIKIKSLHHMSCVQ